MALGTVPSKFEFECSSEPSTIALLSVKSPALIGSVSPMTAFAPMALGATPPDQFEPVSRLPGFDAVQVRVWPHESAGATATATGMTRRIHGLARTWRKKRKLNI